MNQQSLADKIKSETEKLNSKIVEFRRHLHMNPELSFEEKETSSYISSVLSANNIPHDTEIGGFGIVAKLEGSGSGPTVLLRADMDALPIHEETGLSYRSKKDGVMHACGHDAHTACLLGSVLTLNQLKKYWSGKVVAVFQPAEEKIPGGALAMLQDGLMEKYQPEIAFGQHVHPLLETGKVAFIHGKAMASADEVYLTVKGRGGHAAIVRDCIDPLPITAQIITGIQQLVSRKADPLIPTVVSFGKINSTGGATNIIPSEIKLEGTIRTFDEHWRLELHELLEKMCKQIALAHGAACEVFIKKGYPALINNLELVSQAQSYAEKLIGAENVVVIGPRMTAEDFAYFAQAMPSCFFRLGTATAGKKITPIHSQDFTINEDSLSIGSMMMSWLAINKY